MKKRTALIGGATTLAVLAGGAFMAPGVFAKTASATSSVPSLASEIASKFNLSTSDVQAIIDQHKGEEATARQADFKTRLDAAVTAGKITSAQETAIIAEQATIKTQMDADKSLTGTARKTAMEKLMGDVKTWATTNNIPTEFAHLLDARGGRGPGGPPPSSSSSPAPSN